MVDLSVEAAAAARIATEVNDDRPVIDAEMFSELAALMDEDGPGYLCELIQQFLEDATLHITNMEAAFATGDAAKLERAAHTLKSSSANLGALRLSEICQELQVIGRSGDIFGAQSWQVRLSREIGLVRAALDEKCQRPAA